MKTEVLTIPEVISGMSATVCRLALIRIEIVLTSMSVNLGVHALISVHKHLARREGYVLFFVLHVHQNVTGE